MGYDVSDVNTVDFCKSNQIPQFVLYKPNSNKYIDLKINDPDPNSKYDYSCKNATNAEKMIKKNRVPKRTDSGISSKN